jgi:hypothetical protein
MRQTAMKDMIDPQLIRTIFAIHFDPESGTPYWLEQEKKAGINARKDIKTCADFHLLGSMDIQQLRSRPIRNFIPKGYTRQMPQMILSETGGTTGSPCRRVFTPQEFESAFIRPWMNAVTMRDFPLQGRWLFAGPGGPHVIAQAARKMARATGSLEPFSIDCDVRWFRRQDKQSLGFTLYLDHVLSQAVNIIATQEINVLFTTPILLGKLAEHMSDQQRQQIQGIHTGGMAQTREQTAQLQDAFPKAVILPGYGNSLFGVTFEQTPPAADEESVFTMDDPALWLQLVPLHEDNAIDLQAIQPADTLGRVILHRFDPSFLLLNLVERDTACYAKHSNCRKIYDVRPLETPVKKQSGSVY